MFTSLLVNGYIDDKGSLIFTDRQGEQCYMEAAECKLLADHVMEGNTSITAFANVIGAPVQAISLAVFTYIRRMNDTMVH